MNVVNAMAAERSCGQFMRQLALRQASMRVQRRLAQAASKTGPSFLLWLAAACVGATRSH